MENSDAGLLMKLFLLFISLFQIKKMFALADKDNDGKLTISEWKEMLLKTGAPVDE